MKKDRLIIAFLLGAIATVAYATTTVSGTDRWGWSDVVGWLDLNVTNTVTVTTSGIQGYASSSVGNIMFDCATTPSGNTCASPTSTNFQVANDGAGNLSGFAWSDVVGWLSMNGTTTDGQAYRVKIAANGDFDGWAWNDVAGWFNFNCATNNPSSCLSTGGPGPDYHTNATGGIALPSSALFVSSIFDIGTATGVFNSISWRGSQPAGTSVQFQIATATSSAALAGGMDAVFAGSSWLPAPASPPGSPVRLTAPGAGVPVENRRYVRYRALLSGTSSSPRIDDVTIGWSP